MSWWSRQRENFRARLEERNDPRLEDIVLPEPPPERTRAVVVSFYMANIRRGVPAAQRRLLERFLPEGVAVRQIRTRQRHGAAMDAFLATNRHPVVVFLDIDCVPIAEGAIERLIAGAEAGRLIGTVSCAAHIQNNRHLFVGPFGMGVSQATWDRLGRPSCLATARGDVAEELTYEAEARGVPIEMLMPVASDDRIWSLPNGIEYGHGTRYEGGLWHAFEVRCPDYQAAFIARCEEFLAAAGPRPAR